MSESFHSLAPVIHAVPLEGAAVATIGGCDDATGVFVVQAVKLRVMPRHQVFPEAIVEMQIQKHAVHVDQYRVHSAPIDIGELDLGEGRHTVGQ